MQDRTERRAPTAAQIKRAGVLLGHVPGSGRNWTTPEGIRFLDYVDHLAQAGVPTSWLAAAVDLDPNHLYVVLARHRARGHDEAVGQ